MAEFIDLHIHSKFSDGNLSPQEIINYMKEKKVETISITDHNTIKAYFSDYELNGIKLIPGVEIDINYGYDIQFLCYDFDVNNKILNKKLDFIISSRKRNAINLAKKMMKMGIMIDNNSSFYDDINDYDKICGFLVSKGYGKNIAEVKSKYFVPGAALYYDIPVFDTKECIKVFHDAGGKVILAHPGRIKVDMPKLKVIVNELISFGIDGIECYHPDNTVEIINDMVMIANEKKMYITGGSDMHDVYTNFCIDKRNTILF